VQAIEVVYKSSSLALTRLALLLVGDRSEAEDIVQTVFVKASSGGHGRFAIRCRWSSVTSA